jgi:hypothetical protein
MARATGASDTQKTIMLALAEGWRLRLVEHHGWCLFQSGRARPFAQMKSKTIDRMTRSGWLSAGIATKELAFRPEKILTPTGRKYAERLIATHWAESFEWTPFELSAKIDSGLTADDSLAA